MIKGEKAYPTLLGSNLTLADLYLAPMFDYFLQSGEGHDMMASHADLASWWAQFQSRPSMQRTRATT